MIFGNIPRTDHGFSIFQRIFKFRIPGISNSGFPAFPIADSLHFQFRFPDIFQFSDSAFSIVCCCGRFEKRPYRTSQPRVPTTRTGSIPMFIGGIIGIEAVAVPVGYVVVDVVHDIVEGLLVSDDVFMKSRLPSKFDVTSATFARDSAFEATHNHGQYGIVVEIGGRGAMHFWFQTAEIRLGCGGRWGGLGGGVRRGGLGCGVRLGGVGCGVN